MLADYIKRGVNVDVFSIETGVWYLGTIQRVISHDEDEEDERTGWSLNVTYPKYEQELLHYNTSK